MLLTRRAPEEHAESDPDPDPDRDHSPNTPSLLVRMQVCYGSTNRIGTRRALNDGSKNIPFALDEEDDSDVFTSVEVTRATPPASSNTAATMPSQPAVKAPIASAPPSPQTPPPVRNTGPLAAARSTPLPRLTIETWGQPGSRTSDVPERIVTIGTSGADLEIRDEYVASLHALIRTDETGAAFLEDCGSRNGVYLRIADDLALEDWDEIAMGTQRFLFRTTWDASKTRANPNKPTTPAIGGDLPADAARLIQTYTGGQVGAVWRVRDRVTIGRKDADVCEPDDPWLSAPHATIERRGPKFFIKDANSQHGTFIRLLDSVELIDGDVFMVGRSRIKIGYP